MPTKTAAHKINEELHSENGNGQSLIDRLREKSRLRTEVVHVERWEMDVTIRELSAKEIQGVQDAARKTEGGEIDFDRAAKYAIARSCIDPTFTIEDIELLSGDDMSTQPLRQLGGAVMRLNKMGEDGVKQAQKSFPDTEG
jgi:hypothetical protein